MRYAVIIPACDEEACIVPVLQELQRLLPPEKFLIAVGVNGSSDRTAELARSAGVLVAETSNRGYGYGCRAAVDLADVTAGDVAAYIFVAGDGANDPRDIGRLVAEFEAGSPIVLGCRTCSWSNVHTMGLRYLLANRSLGLICGMLAGRYFADLGPLRLMEKNAFRRLGLCEWTYGWTAEAQVVAGRLGIPQKEVPVGERTRIAGMQKVSRVSWRRTLRIGCAIVAAAIRSRRRADRLRARQKTPATAQLAPVSVAALPPAR